MDLLMMLRKIFEQLYHLHLPPACTTEFRARKPSQELFDMSTWSSNFRATTCVQSNTLHLSEFLAPTRNAAPSSASTAFAASAAVCLGIFILSRLCTTSLLYVARHCTLCKDHPHWRAASHVQQVACKCNWHVKQTVEHPAAEVAPLPRRERKVAKVIPLQ